MMRHETCLDGCRTGRRICQRADICIMAIGTAPEPVEPGPGNPHLARLARVKACPHRGEKIGDGCDCLHACGLGKGSVTPGQVSTSDCLACIGD